MLALQAWMIREEEHVRLVRIRLGKILSSLVVSSCFLPSLSARAEQGKDLLDEVIAGSEANLALIQGCEAEYSVSTKKTYPKERNSDEKIVISFDGISTRADLGNEHVIVGEDRFITYVAPGTDPGAIIRTRSAARPLFAHPQMQGLRMAGAVGGIIRSVRGNPEVHVQAERVDKLIKFMYQSEVTHGKSEFWVDPNQGYCVVRNREWNMLAPDRPYLEIESAFERVDSGAFVLTRSKRLERLIEKKGDRHIVQDVGETSILLLKMSVKDVDPKLFTLAGLALPKACRVQDRINGQEYLFGVPAVTDADVAQPPVSGPLRTWHPLLAVVSALCLVGCVAWYVARRRQASGT